MQKLSYVTKEITTKPTSDPIDAQLVFNNINFDTSIKGYFTTTVSGRGTLSSVLNSEQARYGDVFTHKQLPAREITVKYLAVVENDKEYFELQEKLTNTLHTDGIAEFYFTDQPNVFYSGMLASMEPDDGSSYIYESSFVLKCFDPYKRTPVRIENLAKGYTNKSTRDQEITYIEGLATAATFMFSYGKQGFAITGLTVGQKIQVQFPFRGTNKITVAGVSDLNKLMPGDILKKPILKPGDVISHNLNSPVFWIGERWL